ncbi:MAG: EFR1 family ferrodoxin, partial [Eubacteriales bacterium]|nr:EFR1 family ferrodoxin [Eubacteriales bacterium]
MVLYFSGTDNSKHVAESLHDPRTVDIKIALQQKKCGFTLKEGESVGIVCPVYYSGIPKTVIDFIHHMKLKGEITYLYGILTHGGGPGGAGSMLERELSKKGYPLHACFDVKMPSNYIMFGPLKDIEDEKQRIIDAEPAIAEIKNMVDQTIHIKPDWSKMDLILTRAMYPLCKMRMSTKKFYADERCVGCGVCASRCPSRCIEMIDGKPVWTKDECVRCMACLRCNAVQYGKKTKNYRRYAYKQSCDM